MRQCLYDRLASMNADIPNDYREAWGSALSFLDGARCIGGQKYDEAQLFNHFHPEESRQGSLMEQRGRRPEVRKLRKGESRVYILKPNQAIGR